MSFDPDSTSFAELVAGIPIGELAHAAEVSDELAAAIAAGRALPRELDFLAVADRLGIPLKLLAYVLECEAERGLLALQHHPRPAPIPLDERHEIAMRRLSQDPAPIFSAFALLLLEAQIADAKVASRRRRTEDGR